MALRHEANRVDQPLFLHSSFSSCTAYGNFSRVLSGIWMDCLSDLVSYIAMSFHLILTHDNVMLFILFCVCIVQSPSCVWLSATPWTAARQASPSITISRSLPTFLSVASVVMSSQLILWCPLLLLPSVFPRSVCYFSRIFVKRRSTSSY